MRNGVKILGTQTLKCFVKQEGEQKFRIILKQGLNRQIRRMCESLGCNVTSLTRIRIMNMNINGIQPGKWRYFTQTELNTLLEMIKDSNNAHDKNEDALGE